MSSDVPRCWRWFIRLALILGLMPIAASAATGDAGTAADRFTIDQVTEIVLRSNTEFLAAQRSREAAAAAVTTARALPNPRLDAATGDNAQRALSQAVPGRVEVRGVSQLIENPFLRNARIAGAAAGSVAAGHELSAVRNALVAEVRLRAFEVLLRLEEESDAREAVRILEQIRDRVRLRVETGEAPRFELIKADAEIISARQRQVSAGIKAEQAFLTLNRLAAGRLPDKWSLAARLADEGPPPVLDEIQQQVLDRSPELASLRAQLVRAEANLSLARSSRKTPCLAGRWRLTTR